MNHPQLEKYSYMPAILPVDSDWEKPYKEGRHKHEIEDYECDRPFFKVSLTYNKLPSNVYVNDSNFTFPYELRHISNSIEKSKYLLDLNQDWDDEGSAATNIETYLRAIKFIADYSTYIFRNMHEIIIDSPDIDILKDGSIIVNWETATSSFTIIFDKKNTEFSYYYAKVKNGQMPPLKYGVKTEMGIDKITTVPWMANNLKLKKARYFL